MRKISAGCIAVPESSIYRHNLRRSFIHTLRDIRRITWRAAKQSRFPQLDLSPLPYSRRRGLLPMNSPLSFGVSYWPVEPPRCCVLVFAEAVSLAHVARAVTLAQSLDPARYEVHLVCDPRYLSLFDELGFPVHAIRTIKSNVFRHRLANADPLYTIAELRQYVREDLRVMAEWEPDLVVGDFRLSLSVSARLFGVPYAAVTNAYWSPYARPRFLVPEVPIVEQFGPRLAQGLFTLIRPLVFAQHAYALNKVRRDYGLPAVGYDLAHIFSEADYTLYADLPQLVPTINPPSHHRYIGPVVWSFGAVPSWWSSLRENVRTAYVTMGTSGSKDVAQMVAQALACMGWQVLMATADRSTIAGVRDGVGVANYLPGVLAASRADLVVCNGGSAAVYQALAAGTPVLGIPMNLDQYLMMDYIRRFGAGDVIRAGVATAELVTEAVHRMDGSARYKTQATLLRDQIIQYRTGERFQTFMDDIIQGRPAVLANHHPTVSA